MVVTAVILNYKSYQDTAECLFSLLKSDIPSSTTFNLIVIDAESDNKKLKELKEKYPKVKFIPVKDNLGVSGGYNLGFKGAIEHESDYIFMVTPDVTVKENTLKILLERISSNEKIGMVAPKILLNTSPRKFYFIKGEIDRMRKSSGHVGYMEIDSGQYDSDRLLESDFVNCSVVLIRAKLFIELGYWDENYFLYYEDIDWNMRVKSAGYKVGVDTKAVAYHDESSSVKKGSIRQEYYTTRNLLYYINKYYTNREKTIALLLTIKEFISISPKLFSSDRKYIAVKYEALLDFILGKRGYKAFK